jgi:hypothetical protein
LPRSPVSQSIASGGTVVFSAAASGATSYRWQRNAVDIPGATGPTLVVPNAGSENAGTYTNIATNAVGTTTSNSAILTVAAATPAELGRLVNLAIRTNAGTGAQTPTVGFVVGGAGANGSAPLLVRGIGPSLTQFNLSGVLADPLATMFQGDAPVSTNNNWTGLEISTRATEVGAFPLSAGSLDAALAVSPTPGSYTVQVTGNNGGTGLALAEIYDATAAAALTLASSRLVNVSARTQVGTGGDVLIAGSPSGDDREDGFDPRRGSGPRAVWNYWCAGRSPAPALYRHDRVAGKRQLGRRNSTHCRGQFRRRLCVERSRQPGRRPARDVVPRQLHRTGKRRE